MAQHDVGHLDRVPADRGAGAQRRDLGDRPGEPTGLIQVMDHLVHDDPAGGLRIGEPPPAREGAGSDEPQHCRITEPPRCHCVLERLVGGEVAHHMSRVEVQPPRCGELGQFLGVGGGASQRLLADDVLAGLQGRFHDVTVGGSGGDDVNHIDALEQLAE